MCDVVGAVNPALGMVFTAFDSMTFAALDMGFIGKSLEEAALDVGKRMAIWQLE
ncbi:MAG: hypothetical protein MJ215_03640 [Spirochaetia bacterium]|nr:hypothetical protein [Spirochaetia bacterium]